MKIKHFIPFFAMALMGCAGSPEQGIGIKMENMDTSVAPGTDFYQYACGGWIKNNPLKPEYPRFGSFDEVAETNREQIKSLIEDLAAEKHENGSVGQKIGDLYALLMDSVRLNKDGYAPIKNDIERIKAIKDRSEVMPLMAELSIKGSSELFAMYIEADMMDSKKNLVQIYQSGLTLGQKEYYLNDDEAMTKMREAYKKHIVNMFKLIGYSEADAQKKMNSVLSIETRIAKASKNNVELRDPASNYHKMSYDELKKEYTGFDWDKYMSINYITDLKEISVGQPEALKEAIAVLNDAPLDQLKDLLEWKLLTNNSSVLGDKIYAESFDFFGRTMSGAKEPQPRWKRAVSTVNGVLGDAVGEMYVKKYFPAEAAMLAPVPSPLQTHSAYLRHIYNDDFAIVFVGPCVSKKAEADETPGYPDIAITFAELRSWLADEGISLDEIEAEDVDFIPCKAGLSTIYPIEGGQIASSSIWSGNAIRSDALAFSGMEQLMSALDVKEVPLEYFMELLACEGGCINGPGTDGSVSVAERKKKASSHTLKRLDEADLFKGDEEFARKLLAEGYGILHAASPKAETGFRSQHSEDEIRRALVELGKLTKADELNCGGCGYNTCRDMAIAYLDGMAEVEMCVTKMRKEAESKVDVLLRTIPMGVVIVDSDLQIADCNTNFLEFFGDMEEGFVDQSILQMVKGLPLERFVPFADKFRDQFYLSHPGQYRVHFKDKYLRVTFFLVESKRLLGAMFEDITSPTIKRETVVKKAEDVIQKSLETVQQIASLLGENAAETEIMLNSLIDAFSVHGTGEGESDFREDEGGDLT